MSNKLLLLSFLSLLLIVTSPVMSSSNDLEDDFHVVSNVNRGVEVLFPEKFTADQISAFYNKKPIDFDLALSNPLTDEIELRKVGSMLPGETFYKSVMPYTLQLLTGTSHRYANKIRFTKVVDLKNGVLTGLYEYSSSYASLYSYAGYASTIMFPVHLTLDPSYKVYNLDRVQGPCRIFNLKESVLGDKDFISSANQMNPVFNMLPDACILNIFRQDAAFVDQTNAIERLERNVKSLLLILDQLQGNDLYAMTPQQRAIRGDELYKEIREARGCAQGVMTKETYKDCLLKVRADIFAKLGIDLAFVPEVPVGEVISLHEGKLLFVVPDKSVEK